MLDNEVAALTRDATHIVHREFFEMGLHDNPGGLRQRLAEAIACAEAEPLVEAVVLVYGLCGLALVDLSPQRCRLVVPRAHDCITLFLGSKERYAEEMREEPGTYWYAPGWNREQRVPGPDREAKLRALYAEKFGPDEVDALLEMDRESFAHHTRAAYVDLGQAGDERHGQYAARCAESLGWRFARRRGDPRLLRDLLHGAWDEERFLVVEPGQQIAFSANGAIVKAIPAAAAVRVVPA